ncbi:glutamate-1-semialdehyde 2,1-aminomutase [Geothrix sp. 21YS21S-4]|uniref:glutamate-1-semialdehyde 2,1-aminomutase n=1 Tax=Geothrix sp. 21YS21S-4 TaxID=3068889 RepID=UPI0027BA5617|nr:glutamate-1-semialdehyde 2,1-aminomutase [Geothrix sp. 21YS21S-4]
MNYSQRLNRVIPGGGHTYSRGDDQYPSNAPHILQRAKGAYVWDPDGNRYLDYGMALRAVTIGYGYEPVVMAAMEQALYGNNLTRASIVELEAAEAFCNLIPSVEMVKFGKNGSTVTTAAVKLARSYTGRSLVAICAQHPFFSYDDWFIGATALPKGVPEAFQELTKKFSYNDITSLSALFAENPGQIACVILEPAAAVPPKDGFLQKVRDLCHLNGAVFILDEMITGFRFHLQGAQVLFDVQPDLCTFGKGMANGFSVAALAGKREIMELGGIKQDGMERTFLVSTTHGAEMCGMGALLKTIQCYKELGVVEHLWAYGEKLVNGMNDVARELGIESAFQVEGYPCSPNYVTRDAKGEVSLEFRTLFHQEMIRNKVLIPWMALCYQHGNEELDLTLTAVRASLQVYRKALEDGVGGYLEGRAIRPVFRRYN